MKASLRLNNDLTADQLVALATLAESHGFDSIWVSHDLFLRSAPVLLALLARETSRIGIGSCVLNPYSAHPAELAMTAATLQEVSGGRFRLGIAAGDAGFLGWAGIQRRRPLESVRETIAAVRALLVGERPAEVPGAGRGWGADAWLRTGPAPAPIYLGAMGPGMLRLAGAVADGALALLFPPEHYPVAAGLVRKGAAAGSARPPVWSPRAMLDLGIAGGPEEVLARCRWLHEQGATHVSFGPPLGPDPLAAVERSAARSCRGSTPDASARARSEPEHGPVGAETRSPREVVGVDQAVGGEDVIDRRRAPPPVVANPTVGEARSRQRRGSARRRPAGPGDAVGWTG